MHTYHPWSSWQADYAALADGAVASARSSTVAPSSCPEAGRTSSPC